MIMSNLLGKVIEAHEQILLMIKGCKIQLINALLDG